MPKRHITIRIDEEQLEKLDEWICAQPAPPKRVAAVEAAIDALWELYPPYEQRKLDTAD